MGYYAHGCGTLKLKPNTEISEDLMDMLRDAFDEVWVWSDGALEVEHSHDKYHEDVVAEPLEKLAPFVESGDIEFTGEDDECWRFHFWHGRMREQNGRVVYEDSDKDWRHSDRMELLGCLVDAVEDWLESKGITADDIKCEDRDQAIEDGEDPEGLAIIYGEDYDILCGKFERTLINAEFLEEEWA